ncbi:LrgB family protein [Pseudomaricurvus alkylphenolicus]|uniref:LrgB family protein n=1 Tax=Pseudomaricurvus alkylphenolicus TaxID=1306991 RepID=UPI001422C4E3|nr:LrgB family protein [Pseudomaricurvus alkylphenolicus]NIB39575.1 LrgB family protein [Pseudomaricurvus alkylphenolicus]
MLHKPLFGLLLTLAVYQLALLLYERCGKRAFLHPVATSALVIALLLKYWGVPYAHYLQGNKLLELLLGPTTVALAIPLYKEFQHLRQLALPVTLTVIIGGLFATASALAIAWWVGASDQALLALAPKTITTPMAMGVAESLGALTTLTTGAVVFTGVIGVLLSPVVFYVLQLKDPRLQGVVLGLNAHGVGTARSFEMGASAGAFATLTMCLCGSFLSLTLPYLIPLVIH